MFGKIVNGVMTAYPTTPDQLRTAMGSVGVVLPQTIGSLISSEYLRDNGWVWVYQIPHPAYNPDTHYCKYGEPYYFDGKWQSHGDITVLTTAQRKAMFGEKYRTLRDALDDVITDMVEAKAVELGYSNKHGSAKSSCIDYIHSSMPQMQLEARSLMAWIDKIWLYVIGLQNGVENGTIPLPTPEQILAGLPQFEMLAK